MEPSSRAWARRLTVAVALLVGLSVAALPATAAPTTKNYSASLVGGVSGQVTVPSGVDSVVGIVLANQQASQQSFGSAQLDFTGASLPTAVSAPAGWTVQELALPGAARYRVVSLQTASPVPPGASLTVSVTMPGEPAGTTTSVATAVKQSNDFRGTNNDFTLVPATSPPLRIVTEPAETSCEGEVGEPDVTCTPDDISDINRVTADLRISSTSPFTYIARFTTDRLTCDTIPFGPTVKPEPFQMDSTSTSPVSKTLVLTFPRALANLVPDNGTPHHPVCAGGDLPFPGSKPTTQAQRDAKIATHPHEGLLLNCVDPLYTQAVTGAATGTILPMCVQSRARSAGKLVVTVLVQSTTVDPRVW